MLFRFLRLQEMKLAGRRRRRGRGATLVFQNGLLGVGLASANAVPDPVRWDDLQQRSADHTELPADVFPVADGDFGLGKIAAWGALEPVFGFRNEEGIVESVGLFEVVPDSNRSHGPQHHVFPVEFERGALQLSHRNQTVNLPGKEFGGGGGLGVKLNIVKANGD